jgi:hypothetical protein
MNEIERDNAMTETDISITRGYKRYNEKLWEI